MKVFDLSQLEDGSIIDTDLCIVGSGPAGMSIANELAGTNIRVLVLESGGLDDEPDTQALYDIENVGAHRSINQHLLRRRILGGSSHIWTGRCAPFDALDFERRPWVRHSGWPLKRADLEPYLKRAGHKLGLGPNRYDETLWKDFKVDRPRPELNGSLLRSMFWQFSKSPYDNKTAMHFGRDLVQRDAPNVEILLHANVTQINVTREGARVESVDVSTLDRKQARVRSKALALCCGGIENARLLLASRHQLPSGVGNQNDLVGRYLMDHTDGAIGHFDPTDADDVRSRFGHYWLDDDRGRHVFLHGLALSADVQQNEELVNCHAYIEQFDLADDDPWTALRRLYSSARTRKIAKTDARIALTHSGELVRGLSRRQFKHRPQLARMKRIELHCILEQLPDPESRITLSERRDALGTPLPRVNWKISDAERRTARRMGQLIYSEFKELSLPLPLGSAAMENQEDWISLCVEKAHPAGATRMSANPKEGVVDANGQVHGILGLYIAGSSVFPTSGAANPTLMIVAMALRLADHLKGQFKADHASHRITFPSLRERYRQRSTRGADQIKIAFVGAGRRISDIYLPILRAQPNRYEIAGFVARTLGGAQRFESRTGISSFANSRELIESGRPDLLIVAVPDRMSEATIKGLLELKVPILAETPLAWSAAGVKKIIDKATANGVTVGVAEQFPFLPLEQFRQKLIDAGVFGDIYATINDFNSYSYHGIAQLRRYLKGKPIHARCSDYDFGSGIKWQSGSVVFDDGALLVHNYADAHPWRSTRLCGTSGGMEDYAIRLGDRTVRAVRKELSSVHLESISAELPEIGQITWSNPFAAHPFSDEQIAVATALDGMSRSVREGATPLYTARDFLTDIEIIQAFRYSTARNGVPVRLPLKERLQKGAMLVNPRYWHSKLSARRK